MEEIKKEYEILRKKYSLPSFNLLDTEFEIRALEVDKSGILIKAILRVTNNKLNLFMGYLEPVVNGQPQHIHAIIEIKNTTDQDKKDMFEFYKEISVLLHENLAIELKSEKEVASQINKILKLWPKLKEKELYFLNILTQAWTKTENSKPQNEYAG